MFPPDRTAGLEKLARFIPKSARDYAAERNFDRGPGKHDNVSMLSPYIRHRSVTEDEVLTAVLARHSLTSAEKFVQEVFWRTYWKGWLEMRPSAWTAYQSGLRRALDQVQTQSGLRSRWESACSGETGIDCFDHWARELAATGYLHNHARMWFASIWIFTLRLPWELGADFFLRHLLDGDPASNTLGWRWVAGLQTQGKTYVATAANIAKFTENRFTPGNELAQNPAPPDSAPHPPCLAPPAGDSLDTAKTSVLLLHEDDLSPGFLLDRGLRPVATATLDATGGLSPLKPSPSVIRFKAALAEDTLARWSASLGPVTRGLTSASEIEAWARNAGAVQIVTAYAPVGPAASVLRDISDVPVRRILRDHDRRAWPHATSGFFRFREKIPALVAAMTGLHPA